MKLSDILESNVLPFKPKDQPEHDPDVNMSDIHDVLGVEAAEDEMQELEMYFKKAVAGFRGNKMAIYRAQDSFNKSRDVYMDAEDDENFPVMDKAYDNMKQIISSLLQK